MVLALSGALFALGPACKSNQEEKAQPASRAEPAPAPEKPAPATPARTGLTDAQIAAIVVAANQVDIDAGKLAVEKSGNVEVKKFAQQMITDHGGVNAAAVELVTKLKVAPEESDTSRGLTKGGSETRSRLAALDGEAFDRAYVDNEVAYHEAVISVLDTQLIPSATNEELRQALVAVRPAFAAHLDHAKHIQATLTAGSGHEM